MTLKEYLKQARKTWIGDCGLERAILGLVGEAGEVAEKYKKYLRGDYEVDKDYEILCLKQKNGYVFYDKEWDDFLEDITKELGDVLYYWVILCYELDINPEEVLKKNVEKLKQRKKRNKIKGNGDER